MRPGPGRSPSRPRIAGRRPLVAGQARRWSAARQPGRGVPGRQFGSRGPGEEQQRSTTARAGGVVVELVQDALVPRRSAAGGGRPRFGYQAASGVRSWCDAWRDCLCRSSATAGGRAAREAAGKSSSSRASPGWRRRRRRIARADWPSWSAGEGAPGEMRPIAAAMRPEAHEISGRMAASHRISASTGSSDPTLREREAAIMAREPLRSSRARRPGAMFLAPRLRSSAKGAPARRSSRQHAPSQARALDRRRDVHRDGRGRAVEDHRPPAPAWTHPPPLLVEDRQSRGAWPGRSGSVQRRLQLLVQGEPQRSPAR